MSQSHKVTKNNNAQHLPAGQAGTTNPAPLKTVLKFDTGADGFQMMIYVLIIFSVLLLGFGIYFLMTTFSRQ